MTSDKAATLNVGLEIHKHADYSGPDPDPDDGRKRPDGTLAKRTIPWPLSHVEVVGDLPDTHVLAMQLVDKAVDEGWAEFSGDPISYEIHPDPLHPDTRGLGTVTKTIAGDHLVWHVVRNGNPVDVTWKILSGPVPQHWRIEAPDEPSGFAAPHEYAVELVKES